MYVFKNLNYFFYQNIINKIITFCKMDFIRKKKQIKTDKPEIDWSIYISDSDSDCDFNLLEEQLKKQGKKVKLKDIKDLVDNSICLIS